LALNNAALSFGMLFSQFLHVIHQSRDNLLMLEGEKEQKGTLVWGEKNGFDGCWKDI